MESKAQGRVMVAKSELKEFWEAYKIVASVIYPDTGKPINVLGRVSGFVIVNMPCLWCCSWLLPPPSIFFSPSGSTRLTTLTWTTPTATPPLSTLIKMSSSVTYLQCWWQALWVWEGSVFSGLGSSASELKGASELLALSLLALQFRVLVLPI